MPRLVKGGKYIFGWSVVSATGCIKIPGEAAGEYGLVPGEQVVILPGSRTSKGIIISRSSVLAESSLSAILNRVPELAFIGEGVTVTAGNRQVCRTTVLKDSVVQLPLETLDKYGVIPGDRLLAGRGSFLGLAMIARGPIVEEALKHPELMTISCEII
jgi:hypothetical protein